MSFTPTTSLQIGVTLLGPLSNPSTACSRFDQAPPLPSSPLLPHPLPLPVLSSFPFTTPLHSLPPPIPSPFSSPFSSLLSVLPAATWKLALRGATAARDGTAHSVRLKETRQRLRALVPRSFGRTRGSCRGSPKTKNQDPGLGQFRKGELRGERTPGFFYKRKQGKRKGSAPIVSIFDGPSLVNPLTQRLIEIWKRRRQDREAALKRARMKVLFSIPDRCVAFVRAFSHWTQCFFYPSNFQRNILRVYVYSCPVQVRIFCSRMPQWRQWWKEDQWPEEPWTWQREAAREDKNPWLSFTESCESDETEEEPLRALRSSVAR